MALNEAIVARQKGFVNLAFIECKKAAKILPENLVPEILLAGTYLSTNLKDEAIRTYTEIVNRRPEFASDDLGKAYLLAHKQDEAISTFKNLVDMDSTSVPARLRLASLLFKKGSVDEAVKMAEEVMELYPKNLKEPNLLSELALANTGHDNSEIEF